MKSDHRYHFKKKMGYLFPMRPEIKKIGGDGGHFLEVPSLGKEILTIWLYIPPPPCTLI